MVALEQGERPQTKIEAYCDQCPVVAQCAAFALVDIENIIGIWGGVHIKMDGSGRSKSVAKLRAKVAILKRSEHAA